MSDEEETARRLLKDAQVDQTEAACTTMGRLAGALFVSLSEQMPSALVATLTRDWFYAHLCRSLWPDCFPPNLSWDTMPPEPGPEL